MSRVRKSSWVGLVVAGMVVAGCSSGGSSAVKPPVPSAAALSAFSSCADYSKASDAERTQFLTEQQAGHSPGQSVADVVASVDSLRRAVPVLCAVDSSRSLGAVLGAAWQ